MESEPDASIRQERMVPSTSQSAVSAEVRFPLDPARPNAEQLPPALFDEWPKETTVQGHITYVREYGAMYRFYGESELLYLGITGPYVLNRWSAHRRKPWWSLVRSASVQPSSPYQDIALEMERTAIIAERPRFNVIHLRRRQTLHVRLSDDPNEVVDQFRRALLPEDFAAVAAAFHELPSTRETAS